MAFFSPLGYGIASGEKVIVTVVLPSLVEEDFVALTSVARGLVIDVLSSLKGVIDFIALPSINSVGFIPRWPVLFVG